MTRVFKSSVFILFALATTACSDISVVSPTSFFLPCNGKYVGLWREINATTNEPVRKNDKEILIEFRADGKVRADHGFQQSMTIGSITLTRPDMDELPTYRCLEDNNVLIETPRWQIVKGDTISIEVPESRSVSKFTLADNRLKILSAGKESVYERLGSIN